LDISNYQSQKAKLNNSISILLSNFKCDSNRLSKKLNVFTLLTGFPSCLPIDHNFVVLLENQIYKNTTKYIPLKN